AVEAAKVRLRPILMTSFAFILGVFPLVIANGAGAEMRRTLGTAVFAGMLGVPLFGLFLTPVFYSVIRRLVGRQEPAVASGEMSRADVATTPALPAAEGGERGTGNGRRQGESAIADEVASGGGERARRRPGAVLEKLIEGVRAP